MPSRATYGLRDRFRYAVDNSLAKGMWVVLVWMGIGLVTAVFIVGAVMWLFQAGPGDRPVPLLEGIWIALTRSLDPGTFGQDQGPHFRLAGLAITVIGLLAIALLIGLVANAVTQRLEDLRQGRSIVLEADHTLILGYSGKLTLVVQELMEANASTRGKAIVILSPQDKVELERVLRREVPRQGTRIIIRRGEPASMLELAQGRPEYARNIIILRPDEHDADAQVVKVTLAVCKAREGLEQIPIVAELQDAEVARGLRQALPGRFMTVVAGEVVARVAAQTSRAAGLGTLYQELLDFAGDEIYLVSVPPSLVGRPFADALLASSTCSVLGIVDAEGGIQLCPASDRLLQREDHLVMIAADDSAIEFNLEFPKAETVNQVDLTPRPPAQEHVLVIGWNAMAPRIVTEIDEHVALGSRLRILVDEAPSQDFAAHALSHLVKQSITIQHGSVIDRASIDEALNHGPYNHIMVLCQHEGRSPLQADARALLALLHVRNSLKAQGGAALQANVVTEIMQSEAVDLAQVAQPDDFIVSQRLVSLLITQLVEDPRRKPILYELLDSHGAQFVLYPVEDCNLVGRYQFREIIQRLRKSGAIPIGWQAASYARHERALRGGMRINPCKDEAVDLAKGDQIILLIRPRP